MPTSIWRSTERSGVASERPASDARLPAVSCCIEKVYDSLERRFRTTASRLRLGDGLRKETDVGPVVNESQFNKILKYIEIGKEEGAKLILGGKAYREGQLFEGVFYRAHHL